MPVTDHIHKKPVQLQLNNSGAWKTIVKFDAADDANSDKVMAAGIFLSGLDHTARFRVATRDPLPHVLMYMEKGEWRKA
jgi:hypothetical protein